MGGSPFAMTPGRFVAGSEPHPGAGGKSAGRRPVATAEAVVQAMTCNSPPVRVAISWLAPAPVPSPSQANAPVVRL